MKKQIITTLIALSLCICSNAQSAADNELENQTNIVFGVSQLVLGGFNVEGNLMIGHLAVDYSHGISLDLSNSGLEDGADKQQGLAIHIPWTTGFGLGYRFNNWLNLRAEPKWHKFELYYDGDVQNNENRIGDYTTFTLGLGAYANIKPFKKSNNFLNGLMVVPNVRWWPRVSSSLDNDELAYSNRITNSLEVHEAREIGIGNTPFFFNVSIGYSF